MFLAAQSSEKKNKFKRNNEVLFNVTINITRLYLTGLIGKYGIMVDLRTNLTKANINIIMYVAYINFHMVTHLCRDTSRRKTSEIKT